MIWQSAATASRRQKSSSIGLAGDIMGFACDRPLLRHPILSKQIWSSTVAISLMGKVLVPAKIANVND
ncbi:MAG TPA: hypothetical protein PK867_12180, partial [Pirellulales bacterium]|nr:hypothetical protein [Pirellulales bacterium]